MKRMGKMPYTEPVLRRLKRIEGQVRGLARMVFEGVYCVDIITQSSAIKAALSAVEDIVLEGHLSTHAADQMSSGNKAEAVREIVSVYKLSKRK